MGNFFYKKIVCIKCKELNIKPTHFIKTCYTDDNVSEFLVEKIDKCDKYSNILPNDKKTEKNIVYVCSNGHTIKNG